MRTWRTPAGKESALCADILRQPHTLIAGTTGSGKSVLMNSIIYAALFDAPCQKQFIFIDTKRTELYEYARLPHTLYYCDDPEEAARVLQHVVQIILDRSNRTRAAGLRKSTEPDLYVIIDELGDLIFSNRDAVDALARIAMIGRSANVHLIAGTQCPNRKTLSAEFAANCAARVGLRCRDRIESRQVIGSPAAASLPLYGSGYYVAPQFPQPVLVEIPMTSEQDLHERIQWWMAQA